MLADLCSTLIVKLMALITLAVLSAIPAALAGTEFVASTTDERGAPMA